MNIVVIGMGDVGKHIAFMLALENHNIIIVDSNRSVLQSAEEKMDVMAIGGHGCSPETLNLASVNKAHLVIAVTNNDEINLLAANLAKNFGAEKVIARVEQRDFLPEGRGFYNDYLGADLVISPHVLTSIEIIKVIKSTSALSSFSFAENRVELIKVAVPAKSKYLDVSVGSIKIPEMVKLLALVRDNEYIAASDDELIQPGDQLYLIGHVKSIKRVEKQFEVSKTFKNKKVMLVGGEDLALEIAKELQKLEIQCTLIDSDPKRCEYLSEQLMKTDVVCGDATNPSFLQEEHIESYDVFVALSSNDEINLMTTLLAKREGVNKTVALTQTSSYLKIYEELGIDVTISPRMITANHILKFVRKGEVANLAVLEDINAEIIEMYIDSTSKSCGKTVQDINLPYGAFIALISKYGKGIIHADDTVLLEENDTVIIFLKPELRPNVERLFKRKSLVF